MAETAVEGEELHKTTTDMINTQTGTISILGTKGHDNGTYKLSEKLAENLRHYLAKYQKEHPFPTARQLGDAWRFYRNRRARELNKPELKKIQLKNLRNYAGAIFYLTKGKDPIQTKHFMRHKLLQTTMDYLRGLTEFTAKAEYITKAVKLGQPDTIDQISELSNQGFKKYTEADGYQIFRILKY
jgi:integrase